MQTSHFWFLSRHVDRLSAEEDLRNLQVGIGYTGGKEAYELVVDDLHKRLSGDVSQAPPVMIETPDGRDAAFDREGFEALKAKIAGF